MRNFGMVVAFLALLGLAQPALAAPLVGKIDDFQGTPISNVKVAIIGPHGKQVMSLVTDRNGTFSAHNLPPGDYDLELHPLTGGLLGAKFQFYLPPTGGTVLWTIVPPDPYLVLAPSLAPLGVCEESSIV